MANPMKPEVLRLYKRIMRLSQSWRAISPSNNDEEREYIRQEARTWFQRNKHVENVHQIKDHIQEAEARLEMGIQILLSSPFYTTYLAKSLALHYRNPHPRPINLPPKTYTAVQGKKHGTAQKRLREQSRPVYVKSIDNESGFTQTS